MKNLVNCTPVEFLKQTNKIRHSAEKWIKGTKILEIRKNRAKLLEITDSMTDDEKDKINAENTKRLREQAMKNLSDILDVALDTHAEETMELLALMCFVEPADINNHKATEYIKEFGEMIADKDVIDFFTSLMRLGETNTLFAVNQ